MESEKHDGEMPGSYMYRIVVYGGSNVDSNQ